jgi:hypothetical protein
MGSASPIAEMPPTRRCAAQNCTSSNLTQNASSWNSKQKTFNSVYSNQTKNSNNYKNSRLSSLNLDFALKVLVTLFSWQIVNLHTLDASLVASVWICVAETMELRLIHGV